MPESSGTSGADDDQPAVVFGDGLVGELAVEEGGIRLAAEYGAGELFGELVLDQRRAGPGQVLGVLWWPPGRRPCPR